MRSTRRPGATFVEIMVAAVLMILVLGGAWFFFATARRQTDQAFKYSSILQAATSISARLQIDLAAAYVPAGDPLSSDLFEVSEDGKTLGFTRSPPPEGDVEQASLASSNRRWLEYSTEPGPTADTMILKRTFGEQVTRWLGTPLKHLAFRLERANGRSFVVAEMLIVDEDTATRPDLSNRRPLGVRVVKRLRDSANFRGLDGILNEFPAAVLGPLPGETGTVPDLPVAEDPEVPPEEPDGVGLEVSF